MELTSFRQLDSSELHFVYSVLDFIQFDLKLGCLVMLIDVCYYILTHRIQILVSLVANDMDIQLEAFDSATVESLVPVTRLFLDNKYGFRTQQSS